MKKDGFHGHTALLLAIILLILAAELLVLSACGGDGLQSHRPPTSMVTDGFRGDWEEIPTHRVKEMNGLVMGVANDDEYLYLMARSTDLQLARRLRLLGVIVRATGQGAGGSELIIRYHGSVALSDNLMRAGGGPGGGRMPLPFETGEGSGFAVPGRIKVKQNGTVTTYGENRTRGPAAGSDVDGDVYCFEFRFPLDDLFNGPALDRGVAGQKVKLELESGNMTREMREQMILLRNSRGDMGGGESGIGGGMGLPGGEPRKLKVTVKLAGAA